MNIDRRSPTGHAWWRRARLREFAAVRDWEQFHTPKNLAMALAGELLAELQWLTPEETAHVMDDAEAGPRVRSELADVAIYLVRLADVVGVDLIQAAHAKLDEGERRYDAATYRGSIRKAKAVRPTLHSTVPESPARAARSPRRSPSSDASP